MFPSLHPIAPMTMRSFFFLPYLSLLTFAYAAHATEETTDPYQSNLLSGAGGLRRTLDDQGVDVTLEYKGDLWGVTSGGVNDGASYNDNLDVKFGLDGEKMFGLKGTKALIYILGNEGGKPNEHRIGSIEGIDNNETNTNTYKLFEAWIEQSLWDDRLSLLVGLHDMNAEFDETDVSSNFIKPTMELGQSFAQSGRNGPSTFPSTSPGVRLRVQPTQEIYISGAIFDGVSGDPENPHGTHIHLRGDDGVLLLAEAGITPNLPKDADVIVDKFALGAWRYTKQADALIDVDADGNPEKHPMQGLYALSSYRVYRDEAAHHSLDLFVRAGLTDGSTEQVDWDYEAGLVGGGFVPGRPSGEIGFGLSQSHVSNDYRRVSGPGRHAEQGFELYYRDEIYRGINLQPDLQYIIHPGADLTTDNAAVVGIRFDVNF